METRLKIRGVLKEKMKKQPLKQSILTYLKPYDELGISVTGLLNIINGRRTSNPISQNTLYAQLSELMRDGAVESFHRENNRVKKFYRLSSKVEQGQ